MLIPVKGPVDITASMLESQVSAALNEHMAEIRADSSRRSPGYIASQRAQIRNFVKKQAAAAARFGDRGDVSESRQIDIMEAFAQGLRLDTRGNEFRMDALFFAGEGIDGGFETIRQASIPRALSELIPVRSFDPAARMVNVRAIERTGSATVWKSQQTVVPHSHYDVGSKLTQVYHIVTKTSLPWDAILYGSLSDLDPVSEAAWSARETLLDVWENVLVNGFTGTDLQGLNTLPIPKFVSLLDYSNGSVTIDEAYADFIQYMVAIKDANYNRGGLGNTVAIGTKFYNRLLPMNNLAAGGDTTGLDLFAAMAQNEVGASRVFRSMGITRVIEAPSLDNWGGDPTLSAAVVFRTPAGPGGLRQLVGMAPAPVRSSSTLTHDETLWAMSIGGVEANVNETAGIIVAKVA